MEVNMEDKERRADTFYRRPGKSVSRKDLGIEPVVVIEGMEDIIERDLEKHKEILARTRLEKQAWAEGRSHEVKRKKYYNSLIGGGKFNDDALRESMHQIAVNITHLSNKVKAADEKIAFETNIVDTLAEQLKKQQDALQYLRDYRIKEAMKNATNN
jgi:hypothetical protein